MRVAIATLGCKVNQYDSAAIESRLRAAGCTIVPFAPGAEVYVVNTCTVTDRADAESRQLARRAHRFNPSARVIMTGCFAQVNPDGAAIPEVHHVVGLNRLSDMVRAVRGELDTQRILVDDLRRARQVRTLGTDGYSEQTRAFLKIQEGCDLFCTFCIVPFARGRSRSVPPRQVLDHLQALAARGFQEVVLTGVHLGGYGADLDPPIAFCDLLEMLVEQALVPRLRLSSIDPPEVNSRLLELMRRPNTLCAHLHIPIQAAADDVLRRMRRHYDTALLRELTTEIRLRIPEAAIGTDIIAGFPSETDAQFDRGFELLEQLPLTYFHVFPYSRRSGTTAAKLPDHQPPAVIRARAQRLRRLGEHKRAMFATQFIGAQLPVLFEEPAADVDTPVVVGYSRNYQRVECVGAHELVNREISVRITGARGARLHGSVASPLP